MNVTDGGGLYFMIPLPPIGTLDEIHVRCTGTTGAHSGVANMDKPTLTLKRSRTSNDTESGDQTIDSVEDPTTDDSVYDSRHEFGLTGLAHTIDPEYTYYAIVTGEVWTPPGGIAVAEKFFVDRIRVVVKA